MQIGIFTDRWILGVSKIQTADFFAWELVMRRHREILNT